MRELPRLFGKAPVRRASVVTRRKAGVWVWYAVDPAGLRALAAAIRPGSAR